MRHRHPSPGHSIRPSRKLPLRPRNCHSTNRPLEGTAFGRKVGHAPGRTPRWLLQSEPDTPPSIQDLLSVMLIILDRDNMMLKRYDVDSGDSEAPHEVATLSGDLNIENDRPNPARARRATVATTPAPLASLVAHRKGITCEDSRANRPCR